jgi:hypothetical protein
MPQSKVTPVVVGRTDGEADGAVATAAVASATARFATVEDVARAEQRERRRRERRRRRDWSVAELIAWLLCC